MIRTKLTVLNCAILALVLAATGIAIFLTTRQILYKSIDDGLLQRAQFFAASWRGIPPGGPANTRDKDGKSPGQPGPGQPGQQGGGPREPGIDADQARQQGIDPKMLERIEAQRTALRPIVLGLDGTDVVRPETKAWNLESFVEAKAGHQAFAYSSINGFRFRVLSFPMHEDGKVAKIIQIGAPTYDADEALAQIVKTLTIVIPLAVIFTLVVGVVITRRALRPVAEISSAAEQIEVTNLSERLPVLGKDEFAQMSGTFNGLLDRLESAFRGKDEAYAQLRRFTADASHELKTPLTAIQLRTELALMKDSSPAKYKEHIRAIERAATQMSAVVQDLLFLAASDEGQLTLRKSHVSVAEVVEDAILSVDTSHHSLQRNLDPKLKLDLDIGAMTRVLVNIIKNAVTYSEAGKTIRVEAKAMGGKAIIQVIDEGEGIPANHVPLIFERFHRVDSSRFRDSGGSGLGLAITRAIVELHGGEIKLESELRVGTTVTISLPQPT